MNADIGHDTPAADGQSAAFLILDKCLPLLDIMLANPQSSKPRPLLQALYPSPWMAWPRQLRNQKKGRCGLSETKELTSITDQYLERLRRGDTELILPVISYYSSKRIWNPYREKKRQEDLPEYSAVRRAVDQCLQSVTQCPDAHIQFNLDTTEIDVNYKDAGGWFVCLPVSQLSNEYKCAFSLIADIAYRMTTLNPQLLENVPTMGHGIVLIDEIDLHLPPSDCLKTHVFLVFWHEKCQAFQTLAVC